MSTGGDNNLDLIMTEYQPKAQCNGPGTFPLGKQTACAQIIERMTVSQRPTVFGPRGDPATEAVLPQEIRTREALQILYLVFVLS